MESTQLRGGLNKPCLPLFCATDARSVRSSSGANRIRVNLRDQRLLRGRVRHMLRQSSR